MLKDARSPVSPDDCTLIIPAYNEAERIGRVLEDCRDFKGRIIVVCDGTDETAAEVRRWADRHTGPPRITCLEYRHRLGKGGGVLAGMSETDTPCVGFMDADGSVTAREMARLFDELAGCDAAIGSRWVEGACVPEPQPLTRRVESRLFNLGVRLLFGLRFSDTQCGAKVFWTACLDEVLPALRSRGFEFDVELLWRLAREGYRVREVPITWRDTGGSKVGLGDTVRMAVSCVRVRFG